MDGTFCLSVVKPIEVKMMSGFRDNFCWDCLAGSSEYYCSSFCNSEAWLFLQHHLSSFPAQSSALAKSQCVPAGLLALSVASVIMECLCLGRERVPAGWLEFCVHGWCTSASKYWDAIDTISCKQMLKIPERQHCITLHLLSALRSLNAMFDINAN